MILSESNRVIHYLIIGRNKSDGMLAPWIAFETLKLQEANDKCQELIKANPDQTFKIETWTKVR